VRRNQNWKAASGKQRKFERPGIWAIACDAQTGHASTRLQSCRSDHCKQNEQGVRIACAAIKIGKQQAASKANLSDLEFDKEHARPNQAMPAHDSSHVDQITANRTSKE